MGYIQGKDRHQLFLPQCLEDMVSEENPVRVIDAFVDQLSMPDLGFSKAAPAETGRPAYDPRILLKLYLYGYFNSIRSSRRLMRECRRNVELFFLLNGLQPDFRTIADFRKTNAKAIRNVFREFTCLCTKLSLYDTSEFLAIDGSKFRAVNGHKKMYNQEILKKKLQRIDASIEHYLQQLNDADREEARREETRREEDLQDEENHRDGLSARKEPSLSQKLAVLKERKERYEAWTKELKESGQTQKLTTDPEARMMRTPKDGYHCCYNIQTAVSAESHIVTDYQVTNHVNDQGILHEFTQTIKTHTKAATLKVIADKGYEAKDEILACLMDGVIPYVGFWQDKEERLYSIDYQPRHISAAQKNSTKPEDIRQCLHAGVLPACYEHTNLRVEVQPLSRIGAFLRGEDRRFVTCPMGQRLNRIREKDRGIEYACRPACRNCSNRCTASKRHKVVRFGPHTDCVAVLMYGKKAPVQTPPEGFTPTNSFFKKNPIPGIVLLRIADDPQKQRERLCISEHPFGTVKWHHGAHYVLCRGIEKVTAELGLSFLAYNLRRAINMRGVSALIAAMRGV